MSQPCCSCEFQAPMEVEAFSVEWHRRHQTAHFAAFPDIDQRTRDNLDMFIKRAKQLEVAR